MKSWNFHNPTRVHFGAGTRNRFGDLIAGQRLLVVTTARGRKQMASDPVLAAALETSSKVDWVDDVTPNPGLQETQAAIDRLKGQSFDRVVAFGGGSAMDAAKALAAALAPDSGCSDLAALIAHPERHLAHVCLPVIALTTTSGTGAEVTPFATIWNHAEKKKLSLASPSLFPHTAIVDPELTWSLPRDATLSTGLDALNQAFESVWNRNRSPVTQLLASRAIMLAFDALDRLDVDLNDHAARSGLAEASMLAGLCISQTRTAVCHAMSYPITAHYDVPHGFACAFTMGAVAHLVLERAPDCLSTVATLCGASDAPDLVDRLDRLLDRLGVQERVSRTVPGQEALMALRGEMYTPGRSDNFVLPVDADILGQILQAVGHGDAPDAAQSRTRQA